MLPKDGGFLLCRHGAYGDQTHVSVIWPGDLDVGFEHQRDPLPGSTMLAVGGLPASMIAGLSLGPSGFPFYGADTGGYRGGPPDKELFTRWFEQTALSTVMQIGTSASTVAWEMPPGAGYDMEMLGWYRTYTRLHLRLFPYEWTYAQNLAKDGRAIARPLGLAYPDLGQHPDDEYLFGDSILVAPVLARGVTQRSVLLPKGRWIGWWDGAAHDGGQTIQADAPLGTLPLFLAQGGIVPLLRPTIDSMSPTTLPAQVDSYATTPGVLYVRVAPGPKSSFTVFDGAALGQEQNNKTLTLSTADGAEFKLGALFEVVGVAQKPTAVADGGAPLTEAATIADLEAAASGWAYTTDTGGTVWVKTGPGAHTVTVTSP
jgi:alpha-D-xyloside xylohydrolase